MRRSEMKSDEKLSLLPEPKELGRALLESKYRERASKTELTL